MKYFAGLDVSHDETAVCVVDEDGAIVREGKVESDPNALIRWLDSLDVDLQRIGLEAGPYRRGCTKVYAKRNSLPCALKPDA